VTTGKLGATHNPKEREIRGADKECRLGIEDQSDGNVPVKKLSYRAL